MSDSSTLHAPPADPAGRILWHLARWCVIAGGVLLTASAVLTTVSITLNALFKAPIHGEYELVSFGMSWAIYLFLPYCQYVRGNIVVDFFLAGANPRLREALDAVGAVLYAVICMLLIWRLSVGGVELTGQGQATAVLKIPYWWSFPLIIFSLGLLFAVTVHGVRASLRKVFA